MTNVTSGDGDADLVTQPVRRPTWVAHVLDDAAGEPHAILLHLPRGERTALSVTGTAVWQLIVASGEQGTSIDDIAPILAKEYGANPKVVRTDVTTLIEQLAAGDWIEPVPNTAALDNDRDNDRNDSA